MCGIVGYCGEQEASAVIMEGLHKLEYRGYDSAGIATLCDGELQLRREVGKLRELDKCLETDPVRGSCGIGHTRWATHGPPSGRNCHPHLDCSENIAVVHNGIIENYSLLRDELTEQGHVFTSQTDTEVVCHLIEQYYDGDLAEAVRKSVRHLKGAYALGIISRNEPDIVVGARCGSPLIVGLGQGENFLASDVAAVLKYTTEVIYLGEEQVVRIDGDTCQVTDFSGKEVVPEVSTVDWDASTVEKGDYPHFMLKEISEQPHMMRDILARRLLPGEEEVNFKDVNLDDIDFLRTDKIHIVSCGTAWHASLVGQHLMEKFLRVPVEADIASEFRYRDPILDSSSVVIAVSQSGETADTLAGVGEAKGKDAKVLGIINVVGSSIARESDAVVYIYAGPEVAVASTKAYTAQLLALYLLTVYLARGKGTISAAEARKMLDEVQTIPEKMEKILKDKAAIERCADMYWEADDFLFLGRNINLPTALEGALKLKEISYIHAEGCAAGEMKHGHIALVDEGMPVVCVATESRVYDKMVSNIQEIRARKGKIIAIASEGDEEIRQHSDCVIYIPRTSEELSPMLAALPMQLLAYYIAIRRGCDVDQPRNLAKSVTVE